MIEECSECRIELPKTCEECKAPIKGKVVKRFEKNFCSEECVKKFLVDLEKDFGGKNKCEFC